MTMSFKVLLSTTTALYLLSHSVMAMIGEATDAGESAHTPARLVVAPPASTDATANIGSASSSSASGTVLGSSASQAQDRQVVPAAAAAAAAADSSSSSAHPQAQNRQPVPAAAADPSSPLSSASASDRFPHLRNPRGRKEALMLALTNRGITDQTVLDLTSAYAVPCITCPQPNEDGIIPGMELAYVYQGSPQFCHTYTARKTPLRHEDLDWHIDFTYEQRNSCGSQIPSTPTLPTFYNRGRAGHDERGNLCVFYPVTSEAYSRSVTIEAHRRSPYDNGWRSPFVSVFDYGRFVLEGFDGQGRFDRKNGMFICDGSEHFDDANAFLATLSLTPTPYRYPPITIGQLLQLLVQERRVGRPALIKKYSVCTIGGRRFHATNTRTPHGFTGMELLPEEACTSFLHQGGNWIVDVCIEKGVKYEKGSDMSRINFSGSIVPKETIILNQIIFTEVSDSLESSAKASKTLSAASSSPSSSSPSASAAAAAAAAPSAAASQGVMTSGASTSSSSSSAGNQDQGAPAEASQKAKGQG